MNEIKDNIVLFGVGRLTATFLKTNKMNVVAVVDNDIRKHGNKLSDYLGECGCDCLILPSTELLNSVNLQNCTIVICSYHIDEIAKQLYEMGINDYAVASELVTEIDKSSIFTNGNNDVQIIENKIILDVGYYGDHGIQITNALLNSEYKTDIVWIVRNKMDFVPDGVRCVFEGNLEQYVYELNSSKVWIFDKLVPDYVDKRDGQIYIQVKHWSSITLKDFYLGEPSFVTNEKKCDLLKKNVSAIDYFFVGSKFDVETCKRGFGFDGEFVEIGSPRSDVLFSGKESQIRNKIETVLGYKLNEHVILYTPTYRPYSFNYECMDAVALKEALQAKFGGSWSVLIKYHPSVVRNSQSDEANDIFDMTKYNNAEELILISDVLVSDYSSIMFEPAFVKKPVFLYAPDKSLYIQEERGFLLPYDTLPFAISDTMESLIMNILIFDKNKYEQRVESFLEGYGIHEDGNASKRAAEFIMGLLKNDGTEK